MNCNIMILGKELVSDEDASCAAGVICFLYTTYVPFLSIKGYIKTLEVWTNFKYT